MKRLIGPLLLVLGASGCSGPFFNVPSRACLKDSDCESSGEVCFVDGCGSPDTDIVVEIAPSLDGNRYPQDVFIDVVRSTMNFEAEAPAFISGEIRRKAMQSALEPLPFLEKVELSVSGISRLVPGRTRRYLATVQPESSGAYQIPVGTGVFSITATAPSNTAIPPVTFLNKEVLPGERLDLNIDFAPIDGTYRVDGSVVRTASAGGHTLINAPLSIQALDPVRQRALSHPTSISQSQGSFILYVSPDVHRFSTFLLRVGPESSADAVPTKVFTVSVSAGLGSAPLELGDYGNPVAVQGILLGTAGTPLEGAAVYVEGTVKGGGTFRSATALTNDKGEFTLRTLPSGPSGYTLWAVPPAQSPSGILKEAVQVLSDGRLISAPLISPDKVPVKGVVLLPDGADAAGVRIRAEPLESLPGSSLPLPSNGAEAVSDESGRFALALDPAVYRFDFQPTQNLPWISRVYSIPAISIGDRAFKTKDLELIHLSRGRTVVGKITARSLQSPNAAPAPGALLRFFKVGTLETYGDPVSTVLAETTADSQGNYKVILPTR